MPANLVQQLPGDGPNPADDPRALARRLGSWPYIHAETRDDRVVLRSVVSDRVIGEVRLDTGVLTVDVPPELVASLSDQHPRLQATDHGVRLDVHDVDSHRTAQEVLHRVMGVHVYDQQFRAASP